MQKHPLIELYITIGDNQQNTVVEQLLASVDLDDVAMRTLRIAGITQQVMLTLLVTDDDGIREMNKQYRQQDKPTDVLSFPLLEAPLVNAPTDHLWEKQEDESVSEVQKQSNPAFVTPPGQIVNLGDIVISWPAIERQATTAGHTSIYELLYLLSHGVLHLIGYDDHSEAGYQAMVQIQESVLKEIKQTEREEKA